MNKGLHDELNNFSPNNEGTQQKDKTKNAGNVDLKDIYGDEIDLNQNLVDQLNLKNLKQRSPEEFVMVHPPSIVKVDSKLTTLIPYDGYGKDIRPRLSEIQKFD